MEDEVFGTQKEEAVPREALELGLRVGDHNQKKAEPLKLLNSEKKSFLQNRDGWKHGVGEDAQGRGEPPIPWVLKESAIKET